MNYAINVDLSGLINIEQILAQANLAGTGEILESLASQFSKAWTERVLRAGGKGGIRAEERMAYANSIKYDQVSATEAQIWTDYPNAQAIETGRPAEDLKRMLQTSLKVRLGKNGNKYLYIPFRHNVPGNDALVRSMPSDIYQKAKKLEKSFIRQNGTRLSEQGGMHVNGTFISGVSDPNTRLASRVASRNTQWGGRLDAGLAPKMKPHHVTDIYAGMVRMETSTGKSKSSAYLTFRTMSSKSTGWIIPPREGLFIVQKLVDEFTPYAENAIMDALSVD